MTTHGSHEPIPQEALEREHEQRDLSLPMLAISLAGLSVLTFASLLAMAMLFGWFESGAVADRAAPMPVGPADTLPPQPRLESRPAELRTQYEADLAVIMNGYGWLERDASVARIPVHRAMDIIAREGLPVRVSDPAAGAEGGAE